MLRTDLTDHRGTDDARLVRAVADGDAIALAEAYHRTITAAHACARRLLASPVEIEALIRSVYSDLWEEPPVDEALEGWIRARCFALGTGYLRQRDLQAPSRSLAACTSGVDADEHHGKDALEEMIAELTEEQRGALVRAHDQGLRTSEQDDPSAGEALQHALLVLASPLTDDERHAAEMCSSGVALANWIFGLLPPHEAATVPGTAAEPTPCGRLAGVLRRARRRFEPLPPTPDLGHRVLAWVLGNSQARESQQTRASRLDSDLRVASADLDRGRSGQGVPRSSLDMTVPTPAATEHDPQPVSALDPGSSPRGGWSADAGETSDDDSPPRPLRAPSGPPARAGSSPPHAVGNAAPALAPEPVERDDDAGEELVRMPLARPGRRRLASAGDAARSPRTDDPTQAIQPVGTADEPPPPPVALRRDTRDDTSQAPVRRAGGGRPTPEPADGPAPSPLSAEEQRGTLSGRDLQAESPLRRPPPGSPAALQDEGRDTAPQAALGGPDRANGDRSADPRSGGPASSGAAPDDVSATVQTPVQRDDSDPRFKDLFGQQGDAGSSSPSVAGDRVTNMTAPTLPAARRPMATKPGGRPPGRTQPPGPIAQSPTAAAAPTRGHADPEAATGNSVLRWLVVLVLIAAGAAVGIMLGQALI